MPKLWACILREHIVFSEKKRKTEGEGVEEKRGKEEILRHLENVTARPTWKGIAQRDQSWRQVPANIVAFRGDRDG